MAQAQYSTMRIGWCKNETRCTICEKLDDWARYMSGTMIGMTTSRLKDLSKFTWPEKPPLFTCDRYPDGLNDGLDNDWEFDLISLRFRAFIETNAPGMCEFYPIDLRYEDTNEPVAEPYWAVRWVQPVDCLHPQSFDGSRHPDGRPRVEVPLVDIRKLPKDFSMARVKGFLVDLLVSKSTQKKMKKEKITGIEFWDIGLVDADDLDLPWASLRDE